MRRKLTLWGMCLLSVVLWSELAQGQDVTFSQFYATPLQVNPAFAGITLAPRISANYRSQWAAIDGGYVTYAASYEQGIESLNSGIGLLAIVDDAGRGIYKNTRFAAVYGYRVRVTEELSAKFGLQAGIFQTSLDWDRLIFPDQIDRTYGFVDVSGNPIRSQEQPPDELSTIELDLSAGALLYSGNFYGGIALHHINGPKDAILPIQGTLANDLPLRWTVHAGVEFDLGQRNKHRQTAFISPNILYTQQSNFSQLMAGAYVSLGPFFTGGWYRHAGQNADAVIALAGVCYNVLRIGYSYDMTISNLSVSNTGGTHEISLTINLDDSAEIKNRRWRERHQDCFKTFQ